MLDINQILSLIPHRYPFLLVDRIVEIKPDWIVGLKNVSANEPYFQGHFPDMPVMPGVLIVEAMAQVGAVLLVTGGAERGESFDDKVVLFSTIEKAKFRKPVLPGDQLRIEEQVIKHRGNAWRVRCRALVEGQLVAEAILMCHVADKSAVEGESSNSAPPAGGS
jgi:3-hydroxyacyl-[acyl-carrier-protein] dehydratase